ncbi:MAG: dihydrolipoamide acetyltransferase family protein [Acidobacteriota bacterium]
MALVDVIMPQLGESIAEGTISKWHKKQGETIGKDETLLEISTDKVDSEIPSPAAGVVAELLFPEQTTVAVMTVIARIDTEPGSAARTSGQEQAPAAVDTTSAESADIPQASVTAQVQEAFGGEAPEAKTEGRFYSPLVLNIARSEGLAMQELERIEGTGSAGRVTKKDVLAYLEKRAASGKQQEPARPAAGGTMPSAVQPKPADEAPRIQVIEPARERREATDREERIPMDAMRRSIAERMARSKQTTPHVYTVTEADVTKMAAWRERMKQEFERREGIPLTLTPLFLDAVVKALREYPLINASVEADTIVVKKDIHLGVAVALEGNGLIVPVIRHADEKNIAGLARAVNDISVRARSKKLMPEDVQGGTFTVTNPGMIGNLYGIPIINPPQSAILAIGAVKKRPVVVDDAIAIRSMVYLTLSYDHRIIDGLLGGMFLERVASLLEQFTAQPAL